jgi:hypothetical protein
LNRAACTALVFARGHQAADARQPRGESPILD